MDAQATEFSLHVDVVTVTFESRYRKDAHRRLVRPQAGKTDSRRDIDIGGKATTGLAGGAEENFPFFP